MVYFFVCSFTRKRKMEKSQPKTLENKSSNMPTDIVLQRMKEYNVPLTRQNYLDMAYMGNPPEEVGGEVEASIPWEIKRNDRQPSQSQNPNPQKPAQKPNRLDENPSGRRCKGQSCTFEEEEIVRGQPGGTITARAHLN